METVAADHDLKTKKPWPPLPAPQLLFLNSISYLLQGEGAGSGPDKIKVIIKRKACLLNLHVIFPQDFYMANKTVFQ
jgi:hypothetical protein